jgi:RNA polymerase sigma factor FliA
MSRYVARDPSEDREESILECLYRSFDQQSERPPSDSQICEEMKITIGDFYQMLDRIKELRLGQFQTIAGENGNSNNDSLIRYIRNPVQIDSAVVLGKSEIRELLIGAIQELPEIERLVISLHYSDELTLREIGTVLGLNEKDISRLHTKAMLRIRSKLNR